MKKTILYALSFSSLLAYGQTRIHVNQTAFPLYVQPGSVSCSIGKTKMVADHGEGYKDVEAKITIKGKMAKVNSGELFIDEVPVFKGLNHPTEVLFQLSQLTKQKREIFSTPTAEFSNSTTFTEQDKSEVVPFSFKTSIGVYISPKRLDGDIFHIPLKVNFLTACIVELDRVNQTFFVTKDETVFSSSFPYSTTADLPKVLKALTESAMKALKTPDADAGRRAWLAAKSVIEEVKVLTGSPFSTLADQKSFFNATQSLLRRSFEDYLSKNIEWDPLSNYVKTVYDPKKDADKLSFAKNKFEVADVILSELIFSDTHLQFKSERDGNVIPAAMNAVERSAFFLSDDVDGAFKELDGNKSVHLFFHHSGSFPSLRRYRIGRKESFSITTQLLRKMRLKYHKCFSGSKNCKVL